MYAYNDVNNLQTRVKNLYNIFTTNMNYELAKSNAYLDDLDFSNAHDCITRACVYKEIVDALDPLSMI